MGDDANGGCCTLKRGSGIFILVLSILSLVGSIICAVIAGFSEMGLYTAFNWIHFVLLIYLISAASAYVCCRACGPKITGGLAVGYCVLAFVTFIVLATGQRSAIEHNCEGTVECASISDWDHPDPECGRKTSSFSLCYLPETDDRRRRLAALAYAEPEEASEKKKEKTKKTKKNRKKDGAPGPRRALQGCSLTGDLWSSPSGTTNHGNSDGWCYSELDQDVGCTESPRDCWETCLYYYGDDLVAIDWNDDGTCYCQNDCECMSDVGDDETYLITRDSRVGALPHECDDGVVTLYEDKSRGAGCDALDSSGNVVNTNSADHCCQGEGYCCDYGSCTSDSDYCGYRFRCGGRLFVAGPSGGTYYDATAYCSSIGASIATIYSATENELARQACGGSSCWIGLEEVGGDASTPKESQTWRWMDGSTASYTNWLPSEPQNHEGNDERNAIMNCCGTDGVDASGMWYDAGGGYGAPKPLCRTDGSGTYVAPTWYYSKWGDDCQHGGGGGDDHCRVFKTQDDCINYCNPWDDDADEQCEDADDPEDCNSIVTHVNTVAGWSTFFVGLVLFPTLVWVALLFAVPDPQAAAPVTAVELPRMQPQVMMVSPVSPGGGQPQVIMGQPQIVQGGQPQVIMGQPQMVQGGQPQVIMGQQPQVIMGQPQVVQGAPSKLAEF